nr:hypothetical protein [Tanacetum cinerariifolium]
MTRTPISSRQRRALRIVEIMNSLVSVFNVVFMTWFRLALFRIYITRPLKSKEQKRLERMIGLNRLTKESDIVCISQLRMDRSTFVRLWEMVRDIGAILKLHEELLQKPQPITEDRESNRWGSFKGCLGALDGTSISHTSISSETKGSAHDNRVLRDAISRDDGLKIPQAPVRGERYHLNEFHGQQPQSAEEYFNMKHSKARKVIERCFGLLKGHWKILASPSFFPTEAIIYDVVDSKSVSSNGRPWHSKFTTLMNSMAKFLNTNKKAGWKYDDDNVLKEVTVRKPEPRQPLQATRSMVIISLKVESWERVIQRWNKNGKLKDLLDIAHVILYIVSKGVHLLKDVAAVNPGLVDEKDLMKMVGTNAEVIDLLKKIEIVQLQTAQPSNHLTEGNPTTALQTDIKAIIYDVVDSKSILSNGIPSWHSKFTTLMNSMAKILNTNKKAGWKYDDEANPLNRFVLTSNLYETNKKIECLATCVVIAEGKHNMSIIEGTYDKGVHLLKDVAAVNPGLVDEKDLMKMVGTNAEVIDLLKKIRIVQLQTAQP